MPAVRGAKQRGGPQVAHRFGPPRHKWGKRHPRPATIITAVHRVWLEGAVAICDVTTHHRQQQPTKPPIHKVTTIFIDTTEYYTG